MKVVLGTVLFAMPFLACAQDAQDGQPSESRYEGKVLSREPKRAEVVVAVESITRPSGAVLQFGTPKSFRFSLKTTSRGVSRTTPGRVLTIDDLPVGSPVVIYASSEDQPEPRPVRLAILETLGGRTSSTSGSRGTTTNRGTGKPTTKTKSGRLVEYDKACRDVVQVPMVFPVLGSVALEDTFLAPRGNHRRHLGQDLMAPKMTPLLAVFDGTVTPIKSKGHNWLRLVGDNGWTAVYMHLNIDTPGTTDAAGTENYAFAPNISDGVHVKAGQFLGYCGDSGNARGVGSHLHFELWDDSGAVLNPFPSLARAKRVKTALAVQVPTTLAMSRGLVRQDGTIKSFDAARKTVSLAVTAEQAFGTSANAIVEPKFVDIKLGNEFGKWQTDAKVGDSVAVVTRQGDALALQSSYSTLPVKTALSFPSDAPSPSTREIDAAVLSQWGLIVKYSQEAGLDPCLTAAVIQQESGGNTRCVSSSGALGLMQLMPDNVQDYAVKDPFDPEENIRGGTLQLRDYIKMFDGDIPKGLTAYNAGPRRVKDGTWLARKESREYSSKVLHYYDVLKGSANQYIVSSAPAQSEIQTAKPSGSRMIDLMLDTLNARRTLENRKTVAENSRLAEIAESFVLRYAIDGGKRDLSDSVLMEQLAQYDLKVSAAHIVSFNSDSLNALSELWSKQTDPNYPLVGLAHSEYRGRHYWVVVQARTK